MPDFRYKAFISYNRADARFAKRIQKELERFVFPAATSLLGGLWKKSKRPLNPIFLDETELVASADLPATLREKLTQSEYLIVLCSPSAARSLWVQQEILLFTRINGPERILAVVVEGEPKTQGRGLPDELECLPSALRYRLSETGELTDLPAEPLWIDRRQKAADQRRMFLRLVAALLQLHSLDELIQRDKEARRRRLISYGAALVIGVVAVGLGIHAASVRTRQSEVRRAIDASVHEADRGNIDGALRLAVYAARHAEPLEPNDATTIDSRAQLTSAFWQARWRFVVPTDRVYYRPNSRQLVVISNEKTIKVLDTESGMELRNLSVRTSPQSEIFFSHDGIRMAIVDIERNPINLYHSRRP